jgi:hypothetical protein
LLFGVLSAVTSRISRNVRSSSGAKAGDAVASLVEALCCKLEGRRFHSR